MQLSLQGRQAGQGEAGRGRARQGGMTVGENFSSVVSGNFWWSTGVHISVAGVWWRHRLVFYPGGRVSASLAIW